MSAAAGIASLGEAMQIAYVPSDFNATLDYWTKVMGAGPFFVVEGVLAEYQVARGGVPSEAVIDMALGHWGAMQIEIIRQQNRSPSPYQEWRDAGHEGVHHICIAVSDMEHAKQVCLGAGGEIILNGRGNGAEWIYVDTGGGPGSIIEIIRHSEASQGLMDMVREASIGWDGSDPIRRISLG